ncbi:hypothetical protein FOL47_008384 [Perkinsus chesapeaki]|uniref:Tetratricopeptide repeat n=1 Tax=Perkinsus chesapeaki TaxID=330153 RepID=A0A7J6LEB4_PERCH|nr:hypothetical protein FOL47_008384 [Perkinsus chesapeaki]
MSKSSLSSSPPTGALPGMASQGAHQSSAASKRAYKKALELAKGANTILKRSNSSADFEHCIGVLSEAIALCPDKAAFYSIRGKAFALSEMYQRALFDYSMAIRLEPHVAKHYGYRAVCFKKLERVSDCLKDLTQAVKYEKEGSQYIVEKAMVNFDIEDYVSACDDFTAAIGKGCSNLYNVYLHRGICHRQKKEVMEYYATSQKECIWLLLLPYKRIALVSPLQYISARLDDPPFLGLFEILGGDMLLKESIEDLKKAVELNAADGECHDQLGLSLLRDFEKSLEDLNESLELNPNDSNAHFNRGNTYSRLGEHGQALEDYRRAMTIDPKNAEYDHYEGLAHQKAGRIGEAIESFTRAFEKDPNYFAAELHLGLILEDSLARLMDDKLETVEDRRMLGQVYEARGLICADLLRYDEAIAYLNKAVETTGEHLQVIRAQLEERQSLEEERNCEGKDEKSEEKSEVAEEEMECDAVTPAHREDLELKEALKLAFAEHLHHRGAVKSKMRRYEEALEDFNESLKSLPLDSAAVLNQRALCWKYVGNLPEAIKDLTVAVDKSGGVVLEYLCNRAQCFLEFGIYGRADDDLSRAISLAKSSDRGNHLFYRRGVARFVQQRYNEAIQDLRLALVSDPPGEACMPDLYYHLGLSEANLGVNPQRAVQAFTEAIDRLPSSRQTKPHYLHEKAKALQACGEHEKALRAFSAVLDLQPLNARAMFRRAFSFKALKMFEEAAEDYEAARELEPDDVRFVIDYRKIAEVEAVTLGPAGHEDPIVYRDPQRPAVNGGEVDEGVEKFEKLVAGIDRQSVATVHYFNTSSNCMATVAGSKAARDRRRQSLRESLERANQLRESVEKKYGVRRRGDSHDVKLAIRGEGLVGGRVRSRTPPGRAAKSPRFQKETEIPAKEPAERFWSALRGSMIEHRVQHILPEEHAEQAFIDRSVSPAREVDGKNKVSEINKIAESVEVSENNTRSYVSSDVSSLIRQLRAADDRIEEPRAEHDEESMDGDDDILERWRARRKGLGIIFESVDTVADEDDEGGAELVLERIRKRLGGVEERTCSPLRASPSRFVRQLLRRHDRMQDSLMLTSSSSSTFTSSLPTRSSSDALSVMPEVSTAKPSPVVESVVPSVVDLLGSPPMEVLQPCRAHDRESAATGASISFDLTPREDRRNRGVRPESMDSLALSVDEEETAPPVTELIQFEDIPNNTEVSRTRDESVMAEVPGVEVVEIGVQVTPEMIDCATQADLEIRQPTGRRRSFSGPIFRTSPRSATSLAPRRPVEPPPVPSCEGEYIHAREEFRSLVAEFIDDI